MATIVHNTPAPTLTTSLTPQHPDLSTLAPHLDPFHLHTNRAIAAYHHALANDLNFDEPPPLIHDSGTDEDEADDTDIVSPPTPLNEDDHPTDTRSLEQQTPLPLLSRSRTTNGTNPSHLPLRSQSYASQLDTWLHLDLRSPHSHP